MRLWICPAIVLLVTVSCRDNQQQTIDELHQRVVNLTRENATLRERLKKAEDLHEALAQEASDLRAQLKIAHLREMTVSLEPLAAATAPAAASPLETQRRGGFTDFGESVKTSTPSAQVETSGKPSPRQQPSAATPLTNDPDIIRNCANQWSNDFKMVAYCQRTQQEAKDQLNTWDPHKIGGAGFDIVRKHCAAEWGTDYKMRVYCEKQQSEGYRQANAH